MVVWSNLFEVHRSLTTLISQWVRSVAENSWAAIRENENRPDPPAEQRRPRQQHCYKSCYGGLFGVHSSYIFDPKEIRQEQIGNKNEKETGFICIYQRIIKSYINQTTAQTEWHAVYTQKQEERHLNPHLQSLTAHTLHSPNQHSRRIDSAAHWQTSLCTHQITLAKHRYTSTFISTHTEWQSFYTIAHTALY